MIQQYRIAINSAMRHNPKNLAEMGRYANRYLPDLRSDSQWRGIWKQYPALKAEAKRLIKLSKSSTKQSNIYVDNRDYAVLVIGDLHAPITHPNYLAHCVSIRDRFGCDFVVQIGDTLTNHRLSYHEDELDAPSADEELENSIVALREWGKEFPNVIVTIGNHDANIMRKAKTGSISSRWLKPFNEVLELPGWNFVSDAHINVVRYRHNAGGTLQAVLKNSLAYGMPTVSGHIHTQSGVYREGWLWGCLTGVGVDRGGYALRYDKAHEPYQHSCAVVNNGKEVFVMPMID